MIKIRLQEGMKIRCGIFTTDREYAKCKIDYLKDKHGGKVEKYINSAHSISCYMEDGTNYIWINPNDNSRGYRCSQAIVDISTCSYDVIQRIILPICVFADKEDYTIVASKDEKLSLFQLIEMLEKIAIIKGDMPVYYNDYDSPPENIFSFSVNEDGLNIAP